jgi:hypothetical protein
VTINSSFPAGREWHVDEGNATGVGTTFAAFAVCATLPRYTVVAGPAISQVPEGTTLASAECRHGTVPVGGGEASTSLDTLVDLRSTFPGGSAWLAFLDDRTPFPFTFTAFAICAA